MEILQAQQCLGVHGLEFFRSCPVRILQHFDLLRTSTLLQTSTTGSWQQQVGRVEVTEVNQFVDT